MSGETLATQARRILSALHVVFASGLHQQINLPGAVALIKPYDLAALAEVVK
ncbi:MAG: hypothetical protein V4495_25330 [Pseudomonadota bacterium]